MAPTSRPEQTLNLEGLGSLNMGQQSRSANTSATNSPIEAPAGSGLRYPLGNGGNQAAPGRSGAGSPSKEYGSRLFSKRAREIQAQEGLSPQIWGPPPTGSGHSTPLRETIPESPGSDSFPDFDSAQATTGSSSNTASANRRTRAGTVPSRFPAVGSLNGPQSSMASKSNRATPSSSPYGGNTPTSEHSSNVGAIGTPNNTALLQRLRAGSMPQRSSLLNNSSPFGSSVFSSNWLAGREGRERASTLQSVRSSEAQYSTGDLPADNDVRTLDYLGLVDTPQQGKGNSSRQDVDMLMNQKRTNGPTVAELAALNAFNNKNMANRFRSYSVNAKEKYADGEDEELDYDTVAQMMATGQIPPTAENTMSQAAAIHEAVRQHNLEVQAFANFASASRPRARTAGVLDTPPARLQRNYMPTPSRLENSMTAAEMQSNDGSGYNGLSSAVQNLQINPKGGYDAGLDSSMENPTKSLWLGNIPSSTTVSSLNVIFSQFGPIEFARVLTHKSCGFVNFENVQSAVAAKAQYNGKEIFPGCGPIRIGYAKEQSASNTPGANGAYPSPSPDPFVSKSRGAGGASAMQPNANINAETAAAALATPNLLEHRDEICSIVQQFGASQEDQTRMLSNLETAMGFTNYMQEVPVVAEPTHNRVHDAPRLREIRKRIDNNSVGPMEIETIAMDMLPEIAELSSDYLGNTVVQKLFERCSEDTKEAMLAEIAPHLAETGVHKNGTWAAQKIIDVARTPRQMQLIVDALRPHGVNLFLDQYGNYVMQCCLRFQAPTNNFIFETMLNRLWSVAQGRFGARAVRACLESHFATSDQKRLMAAAIALHSVQLATNSNGALLLTWFLDTCNFAKRRSVLAPRLIPHLVHLCTHKVAYLTVLKIINQRNEVEARDSILEALFFEEQTLNDIVSDQACGANFIYKVLTTPFLDENIRPNCLENVRNALLRLKAQPNQGYKRLMDEVGLSTRGSNGTPLNEQRSNSRSRHQQQNGHLAHLDTNPNGYSRPQYPSNLTPQQQAHLDTTALHRTMSMESSPSTYDPYAAPPPTGLMTPQYTHSPALSNAATMSPMPPHPHQQMQYQQAMLAQQQQQQMSRPPPGAGQGYYNPNLPPQMQQPFPGGNGADLYRQQQHNGSPMMTAPPPGMSLHGQFPPQGAPPQMMGYGGYGGAPQGYYGGQGQQGAQGQGGRRGRVS